MANVREYKHKGIPGCRSQRRSQRTATVISTFHCKQAGINAPEGEPWAMKCEDHKAIAFHKTAKEIDRDAPFAEWCVFCSVYRQLQSE